MGQTASGGTFRTRFGAARMLGLIETGQGRVTLTQPGRDVLDNSGNERSARCFLNVELFRSSAPCTISTKASHCRFSSTGCRLIAPR